MSGNKEENTKEMPERPNLDENTKEMPEKPNLQETQSNSTSTCWCRNPIAPLPVCIVVASILLAAGLTYLFVQEDGTIWQSRDNGFKWPWQNRE
jgi:hypothetical protein